MTGIQKKVFDKVLERNPSWKTNLLKRFLKRIIPTFDTNGDGKKRVIIEGKTYLVPIEDIICFGIKAEEVPLKYPEGR